MARDSIERPAGPSRRTVLGAGAAGLGAMAAAAVPTTPAFAEGGGSGATSTAGAATGLGLPPAFIPVTPPGALVGIVGFGGVAALANGAAADLAYSTGGVYSPTAGGFLIAPIPLDTGSKLVRVDVYWKRAFQGTSTGSLNFQWLENGNVYNQGTYNQTGNGVISDAYVFPSATAVGPGYQYYVEVPSTSANNLLMGVLYQYYPAKPQLNLLPGTPARIYDTRPGNNPATPPKVPLGYGTVRTNIDAKANGSGVPAGASAILANVTVVNTVNSGFLAVTKNNSGIPLFSTVNWFGTGQVLANTTVIALDANGLFQAYVGLNSQTDFFVDVIGYYI